MSFYWWVSIQASVLMHRVILRDFLWMKICVTPIPFVGWSCRWSLLMLEILGGSTWVSHDTLMVLFITMLGHCRCIPQFRIHGRLTIALLMVWKRICCWVGPPWWWHVGGILSIVGYLFFAVVGAIAVPTGSLSLVSGPDSLRIIFPVILHVMRDWYLQSIIPVYLFWFLFRLMTFLCRLSRIFASLLARILSGSECVCPTLGMFCVWPVSPPLQASLGIVDCLV